MLLLLSFVVRYTYYIRGGYNGGECEIVFFFIFLIAFDENLFSLTNDNYFIVARRRSRGENCCASGRGVRERCRRVRDEHNYDRPLIFRSRTRRVASVGRGRAREVSHDTSAFLVRAPKTQRNVLVVGVTFAFGRNPQSVRTTVWRGSRTIRTGRSRDRRQMSILYGIS